MELIKSKEDAATQDLRNFLLRQSMVMVMVTRYLFVIVITQTFWRCVLHHYDNPFVPLILLIGIPTIAITSISIIHLPWLLWKLTRKHFFNRPFTTGFEDVTIKSFIRGITTSIRPILCVSAVFIIVTAVTLPPFIFLATYLVTNFQFRPITAPPCPSFDNVTIGYVWMLAGVPMSLLAMLHLTVIATSAIRMVAWEWDIFSRRGLRNGWVWAKEEMEFVGGHFAKIFLRLSFNDEARLRSGNGMVDVGVQTD